MLRSVKLSNFIRLSGEYQLKFHDGGPYFFIGENGSGKSSVLEAIRRCMSYRSNTALSSIGNTQKDSYVICEYELPESFEEGTFLKVYACLVHLKSSSKTTPGQEKKEKHYKLAYLMGKSKKDSQLGVDVVIKGSKHAFLFNESIDDVITTDEKQKIINALETKGGNGSHDASNIIKVLSKYDHDIKAPTKTKFETACECMLEKTDRCVAFIFENRGVGPMQWSQTRKQCHLWRSQERVQIIKRFLFEEKLDEVEQEEEKNIFSILTDDAGLEFYQDKEDKRNVRIKEHGMDYDLLKAPEGLLEAKQCSILLALKRYTTLCLEEPERGMHPQMIQRLRDLFLFNQKLQKKTILITTHHPTFCAPWTVPKTFIFRRRQTGDMIVQKIIPGQRLVAGTGKGKKGEEEIDYKTPRIITSGPLPKLFFSRRVLLVEGENDFIFVTALMYQILTEGEELRKVIDKLAPAQTCKHQKSSPADPKTQKTNTTALLKHLKQFVSSSDLIQMHGETQKERLTQMCNTLDLDHYFLLDRNAVLDEEKIKQGCEQESKGALKASPTRLKRKQNGNPKNQKIIYKLKDLNQSFGSVSKYKTGEEVTENNWEDIRSTLYNKGVFIWRDGDLEDMVIRLCDKKRRTFERFAGEREGGPTDEGPSYAKQPKQDSKATNKKGLLEKLTDLKLTIPMQYYQTKKPRARFKLFFEKELSDVSINKSMELMLEECTDENDDLVQFIGFLLACARSEIPQFKVT